MTVASMLQNLVERQLIGPTVALLVAHPDDEVIGAGAILPLFRRLLLIHVTDGAPRNLADAQAYGFESAAGYAAARRVELGRALALAGVTPKCVELGAPDQGASERLVPLTMALRGILQRHAAAAVMTHSYEGGHPDHDTAAFIAAHSGCPVLEFASYHAAPDGGMRAGAFLPGPEPVRVLLTPEEQARKCAMLAAFATQAATLAPFGTEHELFRAAPHYDFTRPPHEGTLHYERYGWGMTGVRWCALAAEANGALC